MFLDIVNRGKTHLTDKQLNSSWSISGYASDAALWCLKQKCILQIKMEIPHKSCKVLNCVINHAKLIAEH